MKIINHQIGKDPLYRIWNSPLENMIICFFEGGGSIVTKECIYPIARGSLCFVGAGVRHYTMPEKPELYDRSKIYAEEGVLSAIISTVPTESSFATLFRENAVIYARLPESEIPAAEEAYSLAQRGFLNNEPELFSHSYYKLMLLLKRYVCDNEPEPKDSLAVAVEYINRNYSEAISLSDVCRAAHLSKHHLCRKFKAAMGISVMDYILKTRLAAAKELLIKGDSSVGEVAERCGFSCISSFCQSFKKSFGKTALQYKREKGFKG